MPLPLLAAIGGLGALGLGADGMTRFNESIN